MPSSMSHFSSGISNSNLFTVVGIPLSCIYTIFRKYGCNQNMISFSVQAVGTYKYGARLRMPKMTRHTVAEIEMHWKVSEKDFLQSQISN